MAKNWAKLKQKAIQAIHSHGVLLVYPLKNREQPQSLWSVLFPRSEMNWDWSADADSRVNQLWVLREELARGDEVIYAKWFQGRATFFSPEFFILFRAALRADQSARAPESQLILEILEMDSPLSTKQLKRTSELQGRFLEPLYNRATKTLWQRLELVGRGELDEGAFPSLLIGASRVVFEQLYSKSEDLDPQQARVRIIQQLGPDNPFVKQLLRLSKST